MAASPASATGSRLAMVHNKVSPKECDLSKSPVAMGCQQIHYPAVVYLNALRVPEGYQEYRRPSISGCALRQGRKMIDRPSWSVRTMWSVQCAVSEHSSPTTVASRVLSAGRHLPGLLIVRPIAICLKPFTSVQPRAARINPTPTGVLLPYSGCRSTARILESSSQQYHHLVRHTSPHTITEAAGSPMAQRAEAARQ